MLNSKSLWMHNVDTLKPEHTSKNKGSMIFEDQVMFKKEIDEFGVTYLSALTICM